MNKNIKNELIDTFLSKYAYLGIDETDISELIDRINITDNISALKKMLKYKIIALGTGLLTDSKRALFIVGNYINQEFIMTDDYHMALENLKKLNHLYKIYSYQAEPDTLITLINNNKFLNHTLEVIYLRNENQIKKGLLNKLFTNQNNISLIKMYLMINNIEVVDLIEEENDDYFEEDIVQAYMDEIKVFKPKTFKETQEIMVKIKNGDEAAKEEFIKANLRLVVMFANRFYRYHHLSVLDLIQAGNIGLMKAVDKYDVSLGYRFSTYAEFWIMTAITREIQNNDRTIRVPIHMHERISTYNKKKEALLQKKQSELSIKEIADLTGLTIEQVRLLESAQSDVSSLNIMLSDDSDSEIGDLITYDEDFGEDILDADNLQVKVAELLASANLSERELELLKYRYGFDTNNPLKLIEIGNIYGVQRERIRQREAVLLTKLRMLKETDDLADYMDNPDKARAKLKKYRKVYNEDPYSRYKSNPLKDYDEDDDE